MNAIVMIMVWIGLLTTMVYAHGGPEGRAIGEEEFHREPEDLLGISLEIPKKVQDLVGLKTEKVESSSVAEKVAVLGRIMPDTEHTTEVYASKAGVLKGCAAALGATVKEGDVLCKVDEAALSAPADGVVVAQFIEEGERVDTTSAVFMIADLKTLSATFDVYEKDMSKIKLGQKVLLSAAGFAKRTFEGHVTFISPRVDETSFTLKIRVAVDNGELLLKPGMFLQGEILIDSPGEHLAVPTEAIQNLDGMDVVFIQDEPESFTPAKVDIQLASRRQTFVAGDLKAGDVVVADGSFMLKSKLLEDEISGGCSH